MNDELDLTPVEQERLRALPRERIPGRRLEDRTVRALRASGVLKASPASRWARAGLAAAAALAIFAGGAAFGQWRAGTGAAGAAGGAADRVRATGSAYVAALGDLTRGEGEGDAVETDAGRAAALETLRRAAGEVVLLSPDDRLAGKILVAFDEARGVEATGAEHVRRIVWF